MASPLPQSPRFRHVLVTGAAGFAGRHLVRELVAHGHQVSTTDALGSANDLPDYVCADLRDEAALANIVAKVRPDAVIHLAGIAFVPDAAKNADLVRAVNVDGAVNMARAFHNVTPEGRFLFVSTAQVYGAASSAAVSDDVEPLCETAPLKPASPYSRSKADAEAALQEFAEQAGLDLVIARPSNHTGPGQSPKFVAVSFAKQVVEAKRGNINQIKVGNLDSIRDFSDVRDVVAAYRLILEKGCGGVYNIATDSRVSIRQILGTLQKIAGTNVPAVQDDSLFRATDSVPRYDTARVRNDTGWSPKYSLEQTLADILASLDNQP